MNKKYITLFWRIVGIGTCQIIPTKTCKFSYSLQSSTMEVIWGRKKTTGTLFPWSFVLDFGLSSPIRIILSWHLENETLTTQKWDFSVLLVPMFQVSSGKVLDTLFTRILVLTTWFSTLSTCLCMHCHKLLLYLFWCSLLLAGVSITWMDLILI